MTREVIGASKLAVAWLAPRRRDPADCPAHRDKFPQHAQARRTIHSRPQSPHRFSQPHICRPQSVHRARTRPSENTLHKLSRAWSHSGRICRMPPPKSNSPCTHVGQRAPMKTVCGSAAPGVPRLASENRRIVKIASARIDSHASTLYPIMYSRGRRHACHALKMLSLYCVHIRKPCTLPHTNQKRRAPQDPGHRAARGLLLHPRQLFMYTDKYWRKI